MNHAMGCRAMFREHSDAAKRMADTYNLHRTVDPYGVIGKWFAVALSDGTSDGTIYDSKRDCILHQHHNEYFYAYISIVPSSMSVCDAEIFLDINRKLYDKGIRLVDPDHKKGGRELIKRATREDHLALVSSIITGGRKAPNLDYRNRGG